MAIKNKQERMQAIKKSLKNLNSACKEATSWSSEANLNELMDHIEQMEKTIATLRDVEAKRIQWMDFCERMAKAGTIKSRMPSFNEFLGNSRC